MKTRRRALFTLLAGTAVLTGCASPQVTDYAQERPLLELDRYFTGRVLAHGVFQKRNGAVARRFTVVMDCHWEGNQGVLDEAFTYSDGSTERRIWRLTKHADGRYTGRAVDVILATGFVIENLFAARLSDILGCVWFFALFRDALATVVCDCVSQIVQRFSFRF